MRGGRREGVGRCHQVLAKRFRFRVHGAPNPNLASVLCSTGGRTGSRKRRCPHLSPADLKGCPGAVQGQASWLGRKLGLNSELERETGGFAVKVKTGLELQEPGSWRREGVWSGEKPEEGEAAGWLRRSS